MFNKRLRWIFLSVLLPLVQGCATSYPTEADITGTWDGIGIQYILFDYRSTDNAYVVAAGEDDDVPTFIVGRLSNFVSREEDFTLDVTATIEGSVEVGHLRGQLYGSKMVLTFSDEDAAEEQEPFFWLMKAEELDASRAAAREALEEFRDANE